MKVNEIEEIMKAQGYSDRLFSDYIAALKRVRDDSLKCQHCYITAVGLKPDDYKNAINMIQFGLDNYAQTWSDKYRSYYNMAILYEKEGIYDKAKESFQAALNAVPEKLSKNYLPALSAELLRVEMHLTDFTYSSDIELFYHAAVKETGLAQGLRHKRFYRALAEIIIYTHYNDPEKVKSAKQEAFNVLGSKTFFSKVMKKHRFADDAHATEQALNFLKKA